jgi:hypothetical protein
VRTEARAVAESGQRRFSAARTPETGRVTTAAGDQMGMDTDTVDRGARALADSGTALRTAWRDGDAAITAGEPAIGTGVLGAAFRDGYTSTSDAVRRAAGLIAPDFAATAEAGRASAADYTAADQRARSTMAAGR